MIPRDSIARFCVAALSCAIPTTLAAQTTAEKLVVCDKAGEVAEATVAVRDAGVPVEKALAVNDTLGLEGNTLAFFNGLVSLTYVMDGVEGPVMRQVAIQMCQKSMGLK